MWPWLASPLLPQPPAITCILSYYSPFPKRWDSKWSSESWWKSESSHAVNHHQVPLLHRDIVLNQKPWRQGDLLIFFLFCSAPFPSVPPWLARNPRARTVPNKSFDSTRVDFSSDHVSAGVVDLGHGWEGWIEFGLGWWIPLVWGGGGSLNIIFWTLVMDITIFFKNWL